MVEYRKLTSGETKRVADYLAQWGFESWVCGKAWSFGRTLFSGPMSIKERNGASIVLANRTEDGSFRLAYYETRPARQKIAGVNCRKVNQWTSSDLVLVALETIDIAA